MASRVFCMVASQTHKRRRRQDPRFSEIFEASLMPLSSALQFFPSRSSWLRTPSAPSDVPLHARLPQLQLQQLSLLPSFLPLQLSPIWPRLQPPFSLPASLSPSLSGPLQTPLLQVETPLGLQQNMPLGMQLEMLLVQLLVQQF